MCLPFGELLLDHRPQDSVSPGCHEPSIWPPNIADVGQDKGGADLIAEDRIKVKSGVSPDHFTETSVVFNDGSELPADVIIYA